MADDPLSAAQLAKLGGRLRQSRSLADLQQLVRFIESLQPFAENTFAKISDLSRRGSGLTSARITRRSNKTTRSIIAKLRRQTTKLVQMQDLVGCRIVVFDIIDQDRWKEALANLFPKC